MDPTAKTGDAATRRTVATLAAVGLLLLTYAFCIGFQFDETGKAQSSQSPATGVLSQRLNVLFAVGFFISIFLLRQPSILFRSRWTSMAGLGLLSLDECLDRMIHRRAREGGRMNQRFCATIAVIDMALLGFSLYGGFTAIQACLRENYSAVSAVMPVGLTSIPPACMGMRFLWKSHSWSDEEIARAIRRDKLRASASSRGRTCSRNAAINPA